MTHILAVEGGDGALALRPATISANLGNAICGRYNADGERAVTVEAESARGVVDFVAGKVNKHCFDVVDALADFLAERKWGLHTEWA